MEAKFDLIVHEIAGRAVTFAIPQALNDYFVQQLRKEPVSIAPFPYIEVIAARLRRPLKVVDVGANLGTFSLPLAAAGHQVLAIEAELLNYGALVTAISANRFVNLTAVHIAAYSKPSFLAIEGGSAWGQVRENNVGGTRVFALPLVDILEAYGFENADLIKMDIEGAELAALTGMERFVNRNPSTEIIYECNSTTCRVFGFDSQALLERFDNLGFRNYYFLQDQLMKASSQAPQPHYVMDVLATRLPEEEIGYLPVTPYSDQFVETEIRRAANRDLVNHYEHALRQERYMRPEFVSSDLWQRTKAVALEKRATRQAAATNHGEN